MLEELQAADVVLAAGTELSETETLLFGGRPRLSGKLIRIDIEAEQLVCNALPEVAILADAGAALRALAEELADFRPDTAGSERARDLRVQLDGLLSDEQRLQRRVMSAVQDTLPRVIVVGDSTQPVYGANLFYQPEQPRSYFNSSTGYGTLGYALPAALGAKLAQPERPVVALIGDGGLQFTIAELATAVELGLAVPILLWNNRGYGEIKRYMIEHGIPQSGTVRRSVDIYTPDFQIIARGFGCHAERAENFAHLEDLLRRAVGARGPTLIEIDEAAAQQW